MNAFLMQAHKLFFKGVSLRVALSAISFLLDTTLSLTTNFKLLTYGFQPQKYVKKTKKDVAFIANATFKISL